MSTLDTLVINNPLEVREIIISMLGSGLLNASDELFVKSKMYVIESENFCKLFESYIGEGGNRADLRSFILTLSLVIGKVRVPVRYGDMNKLSLSTIAYKRSMIKERAVHAFGSCNPSDMSTEKVGYVCQLYNEVFFEGKLPSVSVITSSRMTTSIGKITCSNLAPELCVSGKLILSSFCEPNSPNVIVGGIAATDRVSMLQLTLEHELVHLLVISSPEYVQSMKEMRPHGKFFKQVMDCFFGHTSYNHGVIRDSERVFVLGELVSFTSKQKEGKITGIVRKVNKKTVVIECEDGGEEQPLYRVYKSIIDEHITGVQ